MTMDASYLTTRVNSIVDQLHGIFDEIGVPKNERNAREADLFNCLSDALNSHLRSVHK